MKRSLAVCTIACYLGALVYGVASYAVGFKVNQSPSMYFFVWDMFCGWSAYEERLSIIGEGESGRFYQLAPAPWGNYPPYGDLSRHHYDSFAYHTGTIAANTLRYTDHEPMARVFVVQTVWSKKFNLPDELWNTRYPEPKLAHHYYHLRQVRDPAGNLLRNQMSWFDYQNQLAIRDNPRLLQDTRKGKPMFQVDPLNRGLDGGAGGRNAAP
ncbi:MAG: hypothetical protein O2820_13940 [Planctomycetota bacterium]|nr:hypothetical protein [Planctomycetota bacterium]MDA1250314.1 hypothetical protein [Planctomycetota bacterium]